MLFGRKKGLPPAGRGKIGRQVGAGAAGSRATPRSSPQGQGILGRPGSPAGGFAYVIFSFSASLFLRVSALKSVSLRASPYLFLSAVQGRPPGAAGPADGEEGVDGTGKGSHLAVGGVRQARSAALWRPIGTTPGDSAYTCPPPGSAPRGTMMFRPDAVPGRLNSFAAGAFARRSGC